MVNSVLLTVRSNDNLWFKKNVYLEPISYIYIYKHCASLMIGNYGLCGFNSKIILWIEWDLFGRETLLCEKLTHLFSPLSTCGAVFALRWRHEGAKELKIIIVDILTQF